MNQEIAKTLCDWLRVDASQRPSSLPVALRARLPEALLKEIEVGELLEPLLKAAPPFDEGGFLLSTGYGGGMGFYADQASRYLVRRVHDGRSCDDAVLDLEGLLSTTSAECVAAVAIWGITVNEPIHFSNGMVLSSFSDLPDSSAKQSIAQAHAQQYGNLYVPMLFHSPPTCALSYRFTASPVIVRPGVPLPSKSPHPSQRLFEAVLPLALIGPSSPFFGPYWTHYLDPKIEHAALGTAFGMQLMDVVPNAFRTSVRLDPDPTRDVVGHFLASEGAVRDRLTLSLTRFSRAMSRRDRGDKALDLAIALEAILIDDAGEHTFKTALRAGLMTNGSQIERMRARAVVSAIYSMRSSMVHSGITSAEVKVWGYGKEKADDVVEEAAGITANVLRRIAQAGSLPDWRQFDLGH